MSKLSLFAIFLFSFAASASGPVVLCEHYLAEHSTFQGYPRYREGLHSEDFIFNHFENASDLAIHLFGFDPFLTRWDVEHMKIVIEEDVRGTALFPMRLRILKSSLDQNAEVQKINFPDRNPTLWQRLELTREDTIISHRLIKTAHPLTQTDLNNGRLAIGFHTDMDRNGMRKFISFNGDDVIEVGLDVPCYDLPDFKDGATETPHVLTPIGNLCRVPIMNFARISVSQGKAQ